MKNIFLRQTKESSRFYMIESTKRFNFSNDYLPVVTGSMNYNMYITSNNVLVENDIDREMFVVHIHTNNVGKLLSKTNFNQQSKLIVIDWLYESEYVWNYNEIKEIIFTTDIKLVENGIEFVDEKFLEWFIDNDSCENVTTKPLLSNNGRALFGYTIIIPNDLCTCVIGEPYNNTCCKIHGKLLENKSDFEKATENVAIENVANKKPFKARPQFYSVCFEPLKIMARDMGYNLLLHGSLDRDIDLVLVSWSDNPKSHLEVLQAFDKFLNDVHRITIEQYLHSVLSGGRDSYVINLNRGGDWNNYEDKQYYLDISFAPTINKIKKLSTDVGYVTFDYKQKFEALSLKFDGVNKIKIPQIGDYYTPNNNTLNLFKIVGETKRDFNIIQCFYENKTTSHKINKKEFLERINELIFIPNSLLQNT